jgi:hypothetical protein
VAADRATGGAFTTATDAALARAPDARSSSSSSSFALLRRVHPSTTLVTSATARNALTLTHLLVLWDLIVIAT